jgi:hypothetical protein
MSAEHFPTVGRDSTGACSGKGRSTNQFIPSAKERPVLWTILVIVVIVLAVIGLVSVLRGRA